MVKTQEAYGKVGVLALDRAEVVEQAISCPDAFDNGVWIRKRWEVYVSEVWVMQGSPDMVNHEKY